MSRPIPPAETYLSTEPHLVDAHVGARLRTIRRAVGMSQAALAERLGLTFQQVQKYERGINRISASKLYDAAQVLGVSIVNFFEGLPGYDEGAEAPPLISAESLKLARMVDTMTADQRRRLTELAKIISGPDYAVTP